jgi:cytochrome P450
MAVLQTIVLQILAGGNHTTTLALGSGMKRLVDAPELADKLRSDSALLDIFIEEVLRLDSPVQTTYRRCTRDVDFHGARIPEGATVEVRFGSANLDPEAFPAPDTLNLSRRNPSSHLAFGTGVHVCAGTVLTRTEMQMAFQSILNRLANLRPSRGSESATYTPRYILYGLTQLWMSFDKRPS